MAQTILDLPDELLEAIVGDLHGASLVATSLTCHRFNDLIPPISREEHRNVTNRRHDYHLYEHSCGGVGCQISAIRRYLDRPHDRNSPRWCVACYRYKPAEDFESEKLLCWWHYGTFVCSPDTKASTNPDVADIVEQLRRTHFDAHYILTTAPYCVHCGSWRGCADKHDWITGPCNCKICGTIDVLVFLAPYKSQRAAQEAAPPGQQPPSSSDHGDSAREGEANYLRGLLGIPGVGVVSRSGKRYMPKYEVQTCASKETKRFVLVVRLEEM